MSTQNIDQIVDAIPNFVISSFHLTTEKLIDVFRIALITASVLPFLILPYLFGKITRIRVKVALVIMFATIINSLSHVSSSLILGFFSPGFFSGLFLLLPYSIIVLFVSSRIIKLDIRVYIFLLLLSFPVYLMVLALSWALGLVLG